MFRKSLRTLLLVAGLSLGGACLGNFFPQATPRITEAVLRQNNVQKEQERLAKIDKILGGICCSFALLFGRNTLKPIEKSILAVLIVACYAL
ncbi:MAG: hypothetical protein WBQ73_00235 [Candidatus Babeliales bacterium]